MAKSELRSFEWFLETLWRQGKRVSQFFRRVLKLQQRRYRYRQSPQLSQIPKFHNRSGEVLTEFQWRVRNRNFAQLSLRPVAHKLLRAQKQESGSSRPCRYPPKR